MIEVEKLAEEATQKDVKVNIYSYYDKKLDQFNPCQIEDKEPDFMANAIKAGLLKGTFKKEQAQGLMFVHLGTFSLTTGEFDIFSKGKILIDCDSVLGLLDNKEAI